ncbi:tetratricopeptide repeat protein [Acetobacter suratthaniensis]|uniref:Tetratricopeptide repeat protein n=2 Tax=Acetobacter suratthaniensis TaxID=1502841 RepID=A0ABS3LKH5_9PROT|nr:tetratricopeptide repeat protein [Acetobacter suratthaniensis]
MRETRFSAGRRNGFLFLCLLHLCLLGGISTLALCGAPSAAHAQAPDLSEPDGSAGPPPVPTLPPMQPIHHPAAPAAPAPQATRPATRPAPPAAHTPPSPMIGVLADQLAHAKTPEQAHGLESRLETLRASRLAPATRLLLHRSEKDLAAEKPDDAVQDLSDALALQPDQPILWRGRAQMRLAAGDLKGAIADLGESLGRDPADAAAWVLLSTIEERRNDGRAALQAWEKAMSLNPMLDKTHKRQEQLRVKAFGQPT